MVLQGGQHKPLADESADGRSGWQLRGACHHHDLYDADFWFPLGRGEEAILQTQEAKRVCWEECKVRAECERFAETLRMDHGVWAGLSEDERKSVRRRRQRHAAASRPA